MSQANNTSIVGTIGTWLAVFLTLVSIILSYMWFRSSQRNSSHDPIMRLIYVELQKLRIQEKSNLKVLERIEKHTIQIKNDAGAPMLVQRMPHSGSQDEGVTHPN